ncbi:MAG: penicillin-binding protein 2, partial [Solirubrobacteraceae bacterium]|nr:penicillin-binding protein 2 [Solirubrobacteraceae bacterium]
RERRRERASRGPRGAHRRRRGHARDRVRWSHAIVGLTERRVGLLFAIFLALLAIGASRATWLGAVRGPSLQAVASTQQVEELGVPARRGSIMDRNGIELAVSEPADDVAVTPYLVKQPLTVAKQLAPLLDMTQAEVFAKLSQKSGFVYLARNLPGTESAKLKKLEIEGLQFIPSSRRAYPRKWLASQVLGWVGTDGDGLAGLEYARDSKLKGSDGKRRIVKDALGKPIVLQETERSKPGEDLRLTLDAELQGKVEDVLAQVGVAWRPKGATALVMDPYSNTVLALANWPRVDANDRAGAPDYAAQNRAVGFNHEPGSTFKAFTVAGALEEKVVTPTDVFNLPPTIDVADRTIGEAHERGTVDLSTSQILAQSSNVGTVRIGQRLTATKFDRWVRRFGFGKPTGIELPGEQSGQVLERSEYSGSSMGNLPIGQGESVTPIQLATAYSAIANGGILRTPRIIAEVGGEPTQTPRGERILDRETAAQLRTMLAGVVEAGGSASGAAIPGYMLAGKTGTANKIDRKTGEYSSSRYIASFVGFAPARKPKLLVTVMVDEPQGEIYGSAVAAPAFQEIMRFALPYLGVAPDG